MDVLQNLYDIRITLNDCDIVLNNQTLKWQVSDKYSNDSNEIKREIKEIKNKLLQSKDLNNKKTEEIIKLGKLITEANSNFENNKKIEEEFNKKIIYNENNLKEIEELEAVIEAKKKELIEIEKNLELIGNI